jgi:hypothetical protein
VSARESFFCGFGEFEEKMKKKVDLSSLLKV